MMRQIAALMLAGLVAGTPALSLAEDQMLFDFEMEDQFRDVHRSSDVSGSIVVVIGSDKDGSEFNELWGQAIHEALLDHPRYDRISFLPLADLRGVPFFLRGLVRGFMPDNNERWVLTDWKGLFPGTYGFEDKATNLLVFSQQGVLKHQHSGREPDDDAVETIVNLLRAMLERQESN